MDVTRVSVQRAAAFVLGDILEVEEEPTKVIGSWLTARRLPCMVLPPIYQPGDWDVDSDMRFW